MKRSTEIDLTTSTLLTQGDWSKFPLAEAKELAREVCNTWDITNRQTQFLNSIDRATCSAKLYLAVWNTTQSGWEKKNLI